jgi:Mrp family chromosome partitioning ATPase
MVFGIIGVLLAIGIDRLDHTLRGADEAKEALAVPCLGEVPKVEPRQAKRIEHLLQYQPMSAYARAIRSLLITVLPRGLGKCASKIILISSALPREGKTTLARSLALSAARLRLRVLLIDLGEQGGSVDRKPGIPGRAGAASVDIVDVLSCGRPIADAVEHMAELGVDYIPPPRPGGNLLHFLASPQDPHWVDRFREAYDFIVIDGPAAIDRLEASFLANWVDQVLLVVRSASTGREMAQNALRLVDGDAGLGLDGTPRAASVLTWVEH